MKPITEEQRQALIEDCKDQIEILRNLVFNGKYAEDNSNLESQLLVQEIALASLTAEVAYGVITSVNPDTGNINIHFQAGGIVNINPDDVSEMEMVETEKLYTTPPVPVINPDQLEGMQVSVDVSTCDTDSGNRIFGRVTSVTESKGEMVLLVEETSRNFN